MLIPNGARSPSWLQPPPPPGCSVLPGAQGQAEEGMFWVQTKIPNPKLPCYSKALKIQAVTPPVGTPLSPSLPPSQGAQRGSAPFIQPSRERGACCAPWLVLRDTFLYPFEVERVSLVDRQADDFGNFKGVDGSGVETAAEEQCDQRPRGTAAPLPLAGAGSRALRSQPCPTLSADFKAPTSSFLPRENFALSLGFTAASS